MCKPKIHPSYSQLGVHINVRLENKRDLKANKDLKKSSFLPWNSLPSTDHTVNCILCLW